VPPRPDPSAEDLGIGPGTPVARPADGRVVLLALGGGLGADLALRSGGIGVAGAMLGVGLAAGILASGRIQNPQARGVALLAPAFAVWFVVRSSPWLLPLDLAATGGLLALAGALAREGSVLDLSLPWLGQRALVVAWHELAAPAFLAGPFEGVARRLRARSPTARAALRGLAIA